MTLNDVVIGWYTYNIEYRYYLADAHVPHAEFFRYRKFRERDTIRLSCFNYKKTKIISL